MNCYDFDRTVFFPDSSYLFVTYCLRRYPRAVLRAMPGTMLTGLLKLCGLRETRDLKEKIFSFLPYLDDVDGIVQAFWAENFDAGIADWYLRRRRDDDVILSASSCRIARERARVSPFTSVKAYQRRSLLRRRRSFGINSPPIRRRPTPIRAVIR